MYSIVTIAGLSLGICVCICIYFVVHFELSYDSFHPDGKRIYRVIGELTASTGEKERFQVVPPAVLQVGRSQLRGVDAIAGISGSQSMSVAVNGKKQSVTGVAVAETTWFDIFSYEWLAGDRRQALDRPFSVVLTAARARQYFGVQTPEKYLGRQLVYADSLIVTVSGIVKEWNENSDLPFTDFLSYPTIARSFLAAYYNLDGWTRSNMAIRIWMKLQPGTSASIVDEELAQLVRTHGDPATKLKLTLQPLAEMHFDADIYENPIATAHRPTLYGLIAMALAILVLAMVNFINLSTANSLQRTKEFWLRGVLGSSRAGLVIQSLTESFLLVILATAAALLLVNPVLSAFRAYLSSGIRFHLLSWPTIWVAGTMIMLTTLLSGLYPAYTASAIRPGRQGGRKGGEKWVLRRGLIVLQFTISLVFFVGSIIISQQLRYMQNKDLGFDADAIVDIGIPPGESLAKVGTLEEMLRTVRGVSEVTRQWLAPLEEHARGMRLKFDQKDPTEIQVTAAIGDEHFIPLYKMKLLAGRNLRAGDSARELVINETLARRMGFQRPDQALGKMLYWNNKTLPVVGVVADFHSQSLHEPITPLCIVNRRDREFNVAVKLAAAGKSTGIVKATLARIERVWRAVYPGGTWTYRFYDETLGLLYENDRRTQTLVYVAGAVTLFISCMGFLGLMLFMTQKRAKEVSIRKVLGASVVNVLVLLCREVVGMVGIAMLVASPLAWWLLHKWLRGFAYRIEIGWWVFVLAGIATVAMALLSVSMQVIRAATVNPVKNLRAE